MAYKWATCLYVHVFDVSNQRNEHRSHNEISSFIRMDSSRRQEITNAHEDLEKEKPCVLSEGM